MARLIESNKNTMAIELKAGQVVLDENGIEFEIEQGDFLVFAENKKESADKDKKKKKKEKKNLTFLYTDRQLKEGNKNPYNKVDFESEFIGNNLQDVDMLLNDYDLEGHGVSPVIDNDGEILGFIYDFDNDGYFEGHAIEDLGLFPHLDYFVYEM